MTSNVIVYRDSTTKTSLESTTSPLHELKFPGVYLCNHNQVEYSFFQKLTSFNESWSPAFRGKIVDSFKRQFIYGENESDEELSSLVKDILRTKFNWTEMIPINEIIAPSCGKDMFLLVRSHEKSISEYEYAYRSPTEEKICCMIFQHWIMTEVNKTDDFHSKDFQSSVGIETVGIAAGVSILVDLESYDYDGDTAVSTGIDLVLGHTSEKPIPNSNGLNIAPGTETLISFGVTKTYVTEAAKQHLSPLQRECYDISEISLTYFRPEYGYKYAMNHCLYESKLQNIMRHCNCTPEFISSTQIKIWNITLQTCMGEAMKCSKEWLSLPSSDKLEHLREVKVTENGVETVKRCLPSCVINELKTTSSSANYPNFYVFLHGQGPCIIMRKLVRLCTDESFQAKKEVFEDVYDKLYEFGLKYGKNGSICKGLCEAYEKEKMCNPSPLSVSYDNPLVIFLFEYAKQNVLYINVAMRDQFYTKIKKDLEISRLDFFNGVGGMLGLCLGLSIISVLEVLFHILKFLIQSDQ